MQRSRQANGQGVGDAASELCVAQPAERGDDVAGELGALGRTAVGQLGLGAVPDALVGVEFGGIRGEVLQAEARAPGEEVTDHRAAVNRAPVQEHDDVPPQVAEQVPEEGSGIRSAEVLADLILEIEAAASPPGTEREAGNDRDAIVLLPMTQERGLASWRPGASYGGDKLKAGFV